MNKTEREKLREHCEDLIEASDNHPVVPVEISAYRLRALLDHIDALEGQIEDHQRQKKNIHSIMEQNAIYDGRPNFINDGYLIHLLNYHGYGGTVSDYKDAKQEIENPRIYKTQIWIAYEDITEKELSRAAAKAALTKAEGKRNG